MKHRYAGQRLVLLLLVTCFGWLLYDYFWGLTVQGSSVVAITRNPAKPEMREIQFTILSDYSESPFIPAALRQFFRRQPQVCFLQPDGSELVNDDVRSPCMLEDDEYEKRHKSHRQEVSTFTLPIFLKPGPLNQKKIFLTSLRKHRGVWLRFSLGGHIIPPAVSATPIFLSLEPYCSLHREACDGLIMTGK